MPLRNNNKGGNLSLLFKDGIIALYSKLLELFIVFVCPRVTNNTFHVNL